MTPSSRKSLLMTAMGAGVITALSIIGNIATVGFATTGRRLAMLAALPSIPGDLLAAFLGIGHGPDGFPTQEEMVPYAFTFLLWWGFLFFVYRWWARRGATSP